MSHADLAKALRDAIFQRSSEEGGAISREQMADTIERVLNTRQTNPYAGGVYTAQPFDYDAAFARALEALRGRVDKFR